MKAVFLVMLASVLAWAESLPPDFEFLILLPFGVGAIGFACDIASRLRGEGAHATPRHDPRCRFDPWATPRASSLLTLRHAARRRPSRTRPRI